MSAAERVGDLVAEPVVGTAQGMLTGAKTVGLIGAAIGALAIGGALFAAGAGVTALLAVAGLHAAIGAAATVGTVTGIIGAIGGAIVGGTSGAIGGLNIGGALGLIKGSVKGVYKFFAGRDTQVVQNDRAIHQLQEEDARLRAQYEAMQRKQALEKVSEQLGDPNARNDNLAKVQARQQQMQSSSVPSMSS